MDRIVVIRPGALGDVILTLPALRILRAQYPDAHIIAVGSPSLWELAGDLVDGRVSIDAGRFATLYADEPSEELRSWLEGVTCVIAWTVWDPSPALRAAGVPDVVHVSPYPPVGMHVAKWLGGATPHPPSPLLPQGAKGEQTSGYLPPSPLRGFMGGQFGRGVVVVGGSAIGHSNWERRGLGGASGDASDRDDG